MQDVNELKAGQKVYCPGNRTLPAGMYRITALVHGMYEIQAVNHFQTYYPVNRNEIMDEKEAVIHAYEIFKGFA
jgi:hypothetical protein